AARRRPPPGRPGRGRRGRGRGRPPRGLAAGDPRGAAPPGAPGEPGTPVAQEPPAVPAARRRERGRGHRPLAGGGTFADGIDTAGMAARTRVGRGRRGGAMMHHTATGELSWLLNDFAGRVAAVRQAVILSRDGLAIAASTELGREDAEHLSALASGVQSLARGAGRHFAGGNVRQTIIEMDALLLFVT